MNTKHLVHYIADLLTWALAFASIGAAWYQTARLLVAFGDPTAPWWPYLAATAIEGAIIVTGLVLMTERPGYTSAAALIVFVASTLLSILAQIGEAALSSGQPLPAWLSLAVRYAAPATVTLTGAALWIMKIMREQTSAPAVIPTPAPIHLHPAPITPPIAQAAPIAQPEPSDNGQRHEAVIVTPKGKRGG
ncbi:MAG TPA: hypothetical protein VI793_17200 [Anaerolineales bacterium]|nr:hypothetical protein [Anaerolineales bacterium]